MPELVLCVDVGSTFTKNLLVDPAEGQVLGATQHPTTRPDVMTAIAATQAELAESINTAAKNAEIRACSSAGGGLRLAVVGHERLVTAEAGQRVALSAGGRVVHLSSGALTAEGVELLRESRPDLIVLTGGTDGGNADVVVGNARRIGIARLPVPVVLACNADAAEAAAHELRRRGRKVTVTGNVLPQIGKLDPVPAREAIRQAFLEHVIGGKGLSQKGSQINGRSFRQLVLAPTPDAVLSGVEVLAGGRGLLMVDVGGATTDVYSVLPASDQEDEEPRKRAAGDWLSARTVEGDLGVRSGATGVVEAALAEGLIEAEAEGQLREYASSPVPGVRHLDQRLAELAVLIAVRRHGRPTYPGAAPRPLREVGVLVGSGGVLRHADQVGRDAVLNQLRTDHSGGWAVPEAATISVDVGYTLFAAGLLRDRISPEAAHRLAASGLSA
ncbi:glutamate mutase L [Kineosporia babensis]|uniref:Glutamate mutase L n=1 Tax=Kineosporia babensis TaxID=499548 RepID=A0A9X1T349_9ACTN|nr:glutamate mutase L [Kineosporia babensis]MCD5315298.1 glutamate mutase L [Kineosporia babensis]